LATAIKTAEYELVLMLDPEIPDERRDQIAADARERISSKAELKHDQAWGMRKMAYEIRQRTEADYRFFRFETESPLLEELTHNLKITDGVLRFRIFKVDPRSPTIEPPPPVSLAGSAPRGAPGRRGAPSSRPRDEAPAAEAPAAEAPDSPPAEPAPGQEPAETPPAPDSPPVEEPAAPTPAPEPPDSPPVEPAPEAPADAPAGEERS
jgi:ribosomal protein S6